MLAQINKIILSITILLSSVFISGANKHDDKYLVFGLQQHYASVLPHAKDLKKWAGTHPYGIQLDIGGFRNDEKSWAQCKCYSRIGFSFIWFDLGNHDTLGHSINTLFFYEPILMYRNRFHMTLKAGIGPSYLTNPYDEISNPENEFFSARISYLLIMQLNFNYRITNHLSLNAAASYNHISNGGIKLPNRGINFPGLKAGFEYSLKQKEFYNREENEKNFWKEKIRYDISFYGTAKSIRKSEYYEQKYLPVFGLFGSASKRFSRFSSVLTGIEWASDGYVKEIMRRLNRDTDHNDIALLVGHELLMGKISFSQILCVYVYNPYKGEDDAVYQRYFLRYQVSDHVHTGVTLKAHRHIAHIFDIRFGVNF
ncbi:acyloxyacyl hydrolase [Bacteroidota bacterium]